MLPFGIARRAVALGMLCVLAPAAAQADWVVRFHNHSGIEVKGIVQNVGIVWLRREQVEEVRMEGYFAKTPTFIWDKPTGDLPRTITANFEQLSAFVQLCVWSFTWRVEFEMWGNNPSPTLLEITPSLQQEASGYKCSVSGELHREHRRAPGIDAGGATIDLTVAPR